MRDFRTSLFSADGGMKVVGVMAAVLSASFAVYMVNTDRSHPTFSGSEHLRLFAQPFRTRGSDAPFVASLPSTRETPAEIDYAPVGSIGPVDGTAERRAIVVKQGAPGAPLAAFTVRQVRNGVASIDGPDGPIDVAPGSVIRRAGRVKAIELRAGRWTVVTSDGTIAERTAAVGP